MTRTHRRSWWAIGALAVGGLWMLFFGCLFLTGYWATVTVTGGSDDGFCRVVWQDPSGEQHRGESDCYGEPPGSTFEVRVSGWPDAGEPTLTGTYVGMGLVFGLPPFLAGGVGLLQLARRTRLPQVPDVITAPAATGSLGALEDQRTVEALRRVRRRAWVLTGLGAVGTCALLTVASAEIEADEDLRAAGVTTVGTVEAVEPDQWWDAGTASVRFTADGVSRPRDVVLGGYADDYTAGDEVAVVYDRVDPARFIIDDALYGPAWTGWVMAPALGFAFVTPFGVARIVRTRDMRRLLATRSWARVKVDVEDLESCFGFTTPDGSAWRSGRYLAWLPDWSPHPYPTDGWVDQPAWWVSDGTSAVFAPEPGGLLVLARRRS